MIIVISVSEFVLCNPKELVYCRQKHLNDTPRKSNDEAETFLLVTGDGCDVSNCAQFFITLCTSIRDLSYVNFKTKIVRIK